jgi:hypothetical protein
MSAAFTFLRFAEQQRLLLNTIINVQVARKEGTSSVANEYRILKMGSDPWS